MNSLYPEVFAVLLLQRRGEEATRKWGVEVARIRTLSGEGRAAILAPALFYLNLHGVGQAVDVVVVTPQQVERHRNTHWRVIAPALREGQEVYHV